MTNATDAAWAVLSTYEERRRAFEEEEDAAEKALLEIPASTLTDVRRKLETAVGSHMNPNDADDWSWKLVRSALEGLRTLDENGEEPDAA